MAAWPAYDAALKAAGVTHEGHIYPGAVHGFNNDATPERYNKAAADEAWQQHDRLVQQVRARITPAFELLTAVAGIKPGHGCFVFQRTAAFGTRPGGTTLWVLPG